MQRLFLVYAAERTLYGERRDQMRSCFLDDVPPHLLTMSGSQMSGGVRSGDRLLSQSRGGWDRGSSSRYGSRGEAAARYGRRGSFQPSRMPGRSGGAWPQVPAGWDARTRTTISAWMPRIGRISGSRPRAGRCRAGRRRRGAAVRHERPGPRGREGGGSPRAEVRAGPARQAPRLRHGHGDCQQCRGIRGAGARAIRQPAGQAEEPLALDSPARTGMISESPEPHAHGGIPRLAEVLPALKVGLVRFVCAGALPVAAFYLAFRLGGPVVGIVTGWRSR